MNARSIRGQDRRQRMWSKLSSICTPYCREKFGRVRSGDIQEDPGPDIGLPPSNDA